jgi:hypothetical protein
MGSPHAVTKKIGDEKVHHIMAFNRNLETLASGPPGIAWADFDGVTSIHSLCS